MTQAWLSVIDQAVRKIEENEIEVGLSALRKIQEHGRGMPDVMLYLAEVWHQLGHLQEAAELLEEVIRNHPELDVSLKRDAELLLAEIALDEGNLEQAQTILYRLKDNGCDETRLYVLLADLYALQELEEVAVKYLELALKREPANQQIQAALSELYFRVGKVAEALRLVEQLDEPDVSTLLTRARFLAQSGDFEAAYQVYLQVYRHDRSPEVLFGCGLTAHQLGRDEEARQFIEALLALEEEYVTGYPLLADICLSLGDRKRAIRALQTYVDLSGFELEPIARLIALLKQEGRTEEAVKYEALYRQWSTEEDED